MEEVHTCNDCKKTFTSKEYLRKHANRKTSCSAVYKCEKCGKKFQNASLLERHSKRKTSCIPESVPIITGNNEENKCYMCGKTYASAYNLKRHQSSCTVKDNPNILIKLFQAQNEQASQINEQASQITKLIDIIQQNGLGSQITNNNNNTMNIQQNNNIYVNVSIVPFGEEDYNKLDHARVLEIIKGNAADFIPQMIEHIHADPKKPEFHNVFYDKQSQAMIKYAAISAEIKTWVRTDPKMVSTQLSNRLTKFIHPLNSSYFNDVLKTNDTETANKIINLSDSREDPFEKNIESLSIITKNPHFTDQVRVQELEN